MSETTEDTETDDQQENQRKIRGKRLILLISVPIFLVIILIVGLFYAGVFERFFASEPEVTSIEETVQPTTTPGIYLDLEEVLVTLRSQDSNQRFLKLSISLELEKSSDENLIKTVMPRLIDSFQVFLRELRIEELEGSQGVYRVKEELLDRVNQIIKPAKVKDLLFRDLFVQ